MIGFEINLACIASLAGFGSDVEVRIRNITGDASVISSIGFCRGTFGASNLGLNFVLVFFVLGDSVIVTFEQSSFRSRGQQGVILFKDTSFKIRIISFIIATGLACFGLKVEIKVGG